MKHCGIQENSNFSSFGNGEPVVCPKPRRLSLLNDPVTSLRWQMCYQQESYESRSGPELLDIILAKGGGYGAQDQTCTQIASSPPFFCGSPPSRVSNPLIQDARFGDHKISPISPRSMIPNPNSTVPSSTPSRKGDYPIRTNKPMVRIEGFNCNRRNCSVPALA